jgi:hypothetical protein
MVRASFRRWWRSLWHTRVEYVPRWWLHCPICDRELVGPFHAGVNNLHSGVGAGLGDPNRQELIAKCPVHGQMPYNDPTKKPPWPRRAYDE